MLKYIVCIVAVVIPLPVSAQEQIVTPTRRVSIRSSPPSPWLLGFPGWKVAQTEHSERYELLRTLKIHAFSSTQTWAEVELEGSEDGSKRGWVYWGGSLDDNQNFEINEGAANSSKDRVQPLDSDSNPPAAEGELQESQD